MNAILWHLAAGTGRLMRSLHVVKRQIVHLDDGFGESERILDLGGGGEGVIGQLCGSRVTAIDLRQDELDEAPPGPTKIVADARNLPFEDRTFEAATAFYFLMYVSAQDRPAVLQEAHRVLRPGCTLRIWEPSIPSPPSDAAARKTFAVPVHAVLPNRRIRTLYGVRWENHEMSVDSLLDMARDVGFSSNNVKESEEAFCLELVREA